MTTSPEPNSLMDALADASPATPRQRQWRRTLAICAVMLSTLVLVTAGGLYTLTGRLADNIDRIPSVFAPLDPAKRPAQTGGTTFLLVGHDSGANDGEPLPPGAQRANAIMVARLNESRTEESVVSIPSNSWVAIPDHGMGKIKAAYAYGGPTLLVRTVEDLTGVRIDHFATIDFAGFRSIVDILGGIDVTVANRTAFGPVLFAAGVNHLNGERALAYVRQRSGLPRGDLDRVHRQQNVLRALLAKAQSAGVLADPARIYRLLDAITTSIAVDDTLSNDDLVTLFSSQRDVRPSDITFITVPVASVDKHSVEYLDSGQGARLWQALAGDDVRAYLAQNGGDTLGGNPR